MAEAGMSVLILERGRPYPPGSFARTPHTMQREMFWEPATGLHGLFDVQSFPGVTAILASGLGGGSLIYANVMLKKDPETFVRESLADGGREFWPVTAKDLEPYYEHVLKVQRPVPFPDEYRDTTPKSAAFHEAARALGHDPQYPPLAVAFSVADGEPPVPGEPFGGTANVHQRTRETCRLCGECDVGCNYGAKTTLDYTYLSRAQVAKAQIRTCCEVVAFARAAESRRWRVRYVQHIEARGNHRPDLLDPIEEPLRTVEAKRLVLAAGTFGSTRLLLTNRAALPGLSRTLGTRFSSNGDLFAVARNCRERDRRGRKRWRHLQPSLGPVITSTYHVPDAQSASGRGYWVQDGGGPAISEWLWHAPEVPADLWNAAGTMRRRFSARRRGEPNPSLGAELAGFLGSGRSSSAMLPLLVMGRDIPGGRMQMRGATLELSWNVDESGAYFDAVEASCRELARAMGGRLMRRVSRRLRPVTVHALGGCPMGANEREGVVDPWGRVYGQPGLYVVDGSIMPGPVGPNPSFTIAAVAERCAEEVVAEAA
jgi:cholesterol oxidase